jgi:organic hydroperoxide reductase OsmC/OhrA
MGSMAKEHRYTLSVRWTGNLGRGTENYRAYSRSHEIAGQHKTRVIDGSSDPAFRGDPSRYNPEELLVGALSSCHMLWFLHLCSDAGFVVTEYDDAPEGRMQEREDGGGEFTEVALRPRVKITDQSRAGELEGIHQRAHELCFIARSVKFPVRVAPEQQEAMDVSR